MEFVQTFWICFLIIIAKVQSGSACDGYTAELVKLENCGGGNPVVYIETNATAWLTENCEVVVNGCGWTTGFNSAAVRISVEILPIISIDFYRESFKENFRNIFGFKRV